MAVPARSAPEPEFQGETHEKSNPFAQKLVLGKICSGKVRIIPRGATHPG